MEDHIPLAEAVRLASDRRYVGEKKRKKRRFYKTHAELVRTVVQFGQFCITLATLIILLTRHV